MQDKFAIGPVTIVQLVGLTTKPRIASAHVDAAVRAADPQPPASAAAGLGAELHEIVDDIDAFSFGIKAPQALSLTATPMRGSISLEAAVDRPAPDSDPGKAAKPDAIQGNIDLASLLASLRGGTKSPGPTPASPSPPPDSAPGVGDNPPAAPPSDPSSDDAPEASEPSEANNTDGAALPGGPPEGEAANAIFDGAEAFGDDEILDFEAYYAETGLAASHGEAVGGLVENVQLLVEAQESVQFDLGSYYILDTAGNLSPEPYLSGQLGVHVPKYQVSAHDAFPPI